MMPDYLADISDHRREQIAAIERRAIRQTAALLVAITVFFIYFAGTL